MPEYSLSQVVDANRSPSMWNGNAEGVHGDTTWLGGHKGGLSEMKLLQLSREGDGGTSPANFGQRAHGEQVRFWISRGGCGPVAFDFASEKHPCVLDQLGDSVYAVYDAAVEGRLISVQVLEEDMGRSPAWQEVTSALVGPTLARRLAAAMAADDDVEQEEIVVAPTEAGELREMWTVLHRATAARLEVPGPPARSQPGVVADWEHLDSALAIADTPLARDRLTRRRFCLPPGFAGRLGLRDTLELRRAASGLEVIAEFDVSRPSHHNGGISVQLVEPKVSHAVRLQLQDGVLSGVLSEPGDLLPHELDFATLLISRT